MHHTFKVSIRHRRPNQRVVCSRTGISLVTVIAALIFNRAAPSWFIWLTVQNCRHQMQYNGHPPAQEHCHVTTRYLNPGGDTLQTIPHKIFLILRILFLDLHKL